MNVPAGIAAIVIAAEFGHRDPLDDAYRDACGVFDIPVTRAVGAISPEGLYPQGPLFCEFVLYCDGSVGCFPCAEDGSAPPVALEDWAHWRYGLAVLGITPPWTQEEYEDFYEWLAVLIEETEAVYEDAGR